MIKGISRYVGPMKKRNFHSILGPYATSAPLQALICMEKDLDDQLLEKCTFLVQK